MILSEALLKVAIPGMLALVGALVGLAIGYFKWSRERKDSRGAAYLSERRDAYKKLFEKIEEAHLLIRSEEVAKDDFAELLFDVNAHILISAVYIDEEDRITANRYLRSIFDLNSLIEEAAKERAPEGAEIKERWAETGPVDLPQNFHAIGKKQLEADSLRQSMVAKSKEVLQG